MSDTRSRLRPSPTACRPAPGPGCRMADRDRPATGEAWRSEAVPGQYLAVGARFAPPLQPRPSRKRTAIQEALDRRARPASLLGRGGESGARWRSPPPAVRGPAVSSRSRTRLVSSGPALGAGAGDLRNGPSRRSALAPERRRRGRGAAGPPIPVGRVPTTAFLRRMGVHGLRRSAGDVRSGASPGQRPATLEALRKPWRWNRRGSE